MSTTKPAIPVTNLKERIAALEQKNAEAGQRSTSPAPGSVGALGAAGTALRDRIAKFEKKGAVPAPRGRFGLGAPPLPEAQIRRNGELYGNRIPQQVRMASTGSSPPSRSGSSIGFYSGSPDLNDIEKRGSFSVNSIFSDFDDGPDYTPLTSPTFAHPPDSPESVWTPPEDPATVDGSGLKEPIKRAAPFSERLEAARKAAEKGGGAENINDVTVPTAFTANGRSTKTIVEGLQQIQAAERQNPQVSRPSLPEDVASTTPPEPSTEITLAADEQTPATVIKSTRTAPTIIVIESPTSTQPELSNGKPPSATSEVRPVVEEIAPLNIPVTVTVTPEPEPIIEAEKVKIRNKQDLSVDVKELETKAKVTAVQSETPDDDDTTPTSTNPTPLPSPLPSAALPSTSLLSTTSSIFSGSSGLSTTSPHSMIDIGIAERVTPATGRGNVVFVPPSHTTMPRKSDLVYFPPTPTKEEKVVEDARPQTPTAPPVTFTAVVHQKVRETPEEIPHPVSLVPQTPVNREQKAREAKRAKRMTVAVTVPPTPTTGELASLIQSAVMLETMVEKGELPTELETRAAREAERQQREKDRLAALAAERARAAAEEAKQRELLFQNALPKKEHPDDPLANKLRHTFLIPLSRARTQQQHRKEASTSDMDSYSSSRESLTQKPSAGTMPEKSPRLPRTPEIPESDFPKVPSVPTLPSKSPSITSSKSRFSSFRRLGSVKSVIGRPSMDTSDEVRSGSVTPPVDEFGHMSVNETGTPSISSPKKSGRAASFAGKIFSRSRTRSTASTVSVASGRNRDSNNDAHSMYTLPPLPDTLSVIAPSPEYEERNPRRSTSLRSLRGLKNIPPPMNIPPVPHLPTNSVSYPTVQSPSTVAGSPSSDLSSHRYLRSPDYLGGSTSSNRAVGGRPTSVLPSPGHTKSPDYLGFGSMNVPKTSDGSRPMSWMSVSSLASELPSPLFEKDIFDAFPAVPSSTPAIPGTANSYASNGYAPANTPGTASRFRDTMGGMPSAAMATPSFDSAFLSTAIHLVGTSQSGTPKSQTTPLPR